MDDRSHPRQAQQLMKEYALRTGLTGTAGDPGRRYLWTDAFAVQTCFGLSHALQEESYRQKALMLIDLVHEHLGKFHPLDSRKGWISGLPEEEGKTRPTVAGLRIGKQLPERQKDESYDPRLEWERDGQYFHYLSRWIGALLLTFRETGDRKYFLQAKDLFLATDKFIYGTDNALAMYWKMSTDLSHPLVASMGAHDPLEGLLCGLSLQNATFEEDKDLNDLTRRFETMCRGKSWITSDALGAGGLLLNTVRAAQLEKSGIKVPVTAESGKLFQESLESLESLNAFGQVEDPNRRLAFRECGLSLGLRTAKAAEKSHFGALSQEGLDKYFPMVPGIEEFWLKDQHQEATSYKSHLDINAVSLAASLTASKAPEVFSAG